MPTNLHHHNQPFPRRWRRYERPVTTCVPRIWQSWLYDKGSLTQRLIITSKGQFQVRVLRNSWGIPNTNERLALHMKPRQLAIIREVELLGNHVPWVAARSIIPAQSLVGRQRRLGNIGTRPLGALLFAHPNMQRGAIEVAPVINSLDGSSHWARRSVFSLDGRPLLVMEAFLPTLLQLDCSGQQKLDTLPPSTTMESLPAPCLAKYRMAAQALSYTAIR